MKQINMTTTHIFHMIHNNKKTVPNILTKTQKNIKNKKFTKKHTTKPTYFTRNTAKLTFDKIILYILTLSKQSTQTALNKLIKQNKWKFTMTKQSLFEAREKLSHTAFIDLNQNTFLRDYAYNNNNSYKNFHGYRLIAVDGSVFDVPTGAKDFGTLKTSGEPAPKAQAAAFVDVLNEYILRAQLQPYSTGETNVVRQMFWDFWQTDHTGIKNIFLFDRGFFSLAFARELFEHSKFLFRVRKGALKEFDEATLPDQIIIRHKEGEGSGGGVDLRLRVINYVLPNGEIEKLVTNIFDSVFSVEMFGELYGLRWGIETCFCVLKSRLQIENFSSAKKLLILQDFHASVFVYNLMMAAVHEAAARAEPRERKYVYKVNRNVAIGEVRDLMIASLVEVDLGRKDELFRCASELLLANVVPVRPGRSFKRVVKHKSAKFCLNGKSGL
jgi:hypothetical protein